jgi:hypothetical protein
LITTRTGFRFNVRPVSPADESGLAEFFAHVSPGDLRFRFLSGLKVVGMTGLSRLPRWIIRRPRTFSPSMPTAA